jgi:stage II sporulation protein E
MFSAEICGNVTAVNEVLDKSEQTDCKKILRKTKEQICGSCGLFDVCWNESEEMTARHFETLMHMKKQGVYLEYKTVPQAFSGICIRTENICSNLNKMYSEYKIRERAENRIREIHTLAAGQFMNVSSLLESLCEDMGRDVRFDMDVAARLRSAAVNCGLDATECCCAINEMEKMTVELRVKKPCEKALLSHLLTQMDILTDRSFNLPEIEEYNDCIKLIYKEKPQYRVLSSCTQFNSGEERFSGDSYTMFTDNNGYFYALLCDGMGTGAKAAVSSSLAVSLFEKLIKAGFGISASVNTVNTSLISGSGDECSVTLDLLVVDLYTGHCEFYKCGATDTLVKKKGKIVTIGFDSMPLGILPGTDIGTGSGTLDSGDIVIICTDGVREEDYYELRQALKVFREGDVRKFTNEISAIIRKKQPEKNDDMTIMTLVLTKN